MKKIVMVLSLAVVATMFTSCYKSERDALLKANDSLISVIDAKDTEMDSLYATLNQIEENLAAINASYNSVQQLRQNNQEGQANVKSQIRGHLTSIESLMAANKQKIASLQAQLAKKGKENSQLAETVKLYEQRIAEQESRISELLTELENSKAMIQKLNQDVSELTAANQEKEQYINLQHAEANRAFYVVGTYKDLRDAGIVNKEGGFIGIGRRQGTLNDMALERFTEIDRTKVTTITVNMRKAKVVSKHPENSYELVMDENDSRTVAYLRILNPAKFWEQTRYLVISTK